MLLLLQMMIMIISSLPFHSTLFHGCNVFTAVFFFYSSRPFLLSLRFVTRCDTHNLSLAIRTCLHTLPMRIELIVTETLNAQLIRSVMFCIWFRVQNRIQLQWLIAYARFFSLFHSLRYWKLAIRCENLCAWHFDLDCNYPQRERHTHTRTPTCLIAQ